MDLIILTSYYILDTYLYIYKQVYLITIKEASLFRQMENIMKFYNWSNAENMCMMFPALSDTSTM